MPTGRVVAVNDYRRPFVIEEYPVPEPKPGAIVLRITQAGVCGSDLHTWRDIPYDRIVSHTYPLADVNQAFEDSEWHERETNVSCSMLLP